MCEDDFKYLAISHFSDWKNFVITRYLRNELDMGTTDQVLQRIQEATKQDEDCPDEPPASMIVMSEEEKAKI
mgnify:FL=1